jgi:hypothetical protein
MKDPTEKIVVLSIACIVAIVIIVGITALAVRNPMAVPKGTDGQAYRTAISTEDSCKDTDGKDFQTEGMVSGFKDGKHFRENDVCINDAIVKEFFCVEGSAYEYVNCKASYGKDCIAGKCG